MTSADLSIQTLCPHYYLSGPLKKRLLVPNSVTECTGENIDDSLVSGVLRLNILFPVLVHIEKRT